MALWHVKFLILPQSVVGPAPEMSKKAFLKYVEIDTDFPPFELPENFREQLGEVLPSGESWHEAMELWGDKESNHVQVWQHKGKLAWIEVRVDVREIDNDFLTNLLALVASWGCVLVEARRRTICRDGLPQLRTVLENHPAARALEQPAPVGPLPTE